MSKRNKKMYSKRERSPGVLSLNDFQMSEADCLRLAEATTKSDLEEFNERMTAKVVTMPEARAARVIQRYEGDGLDINYELAELRRLTAEVQAGSMATQEAMLVSQAHTLDALFSSLALRSHSNMKEGYLEASDRYLRLALKAQAQAAKTIQILADIKNPRPVAFVKQANIAHTQQVNNGARTQDFENSPSKLSGETYELLENARAQSLEGGNDQTLEALGKINGAAIRRG